MSFRTTLSEKKATILVPVGLLHELDDKKSIEAFLILAAKPDKVIPGRKLTLKEVLEAQPEILKLDEQFKNGNFNIEVFQSKLLELLGLQKKDLEHPNGVSIEEFMKAWNAMQGGLAQLRTNIDQLQTQCKSQAQDLVLISKSNPLHIQNIFNVLSVESKGVEAKENPLALAGSPLFVSYLCPAYAAKGEAALYEEVIAEKKLDPHATHVVLQLKSDSKMTSARDEKNAELLKVWAEMKGLKVITREPGQKVTEAIENFFQAQKKYTAKDIGMFKAARTTSVLAPVYKQGVPSGRFAR